MKVFEFRLYHPSGFAGDECHEGCGTHHGRQTPEELGIKNTPGMLAVKALEAVARKDDLAETIRKETKTDYALGSGNPARHKLWKGTTRSQGEVDLPAEICYDAKCQLDLFEVWEGDWTKRNYHRKTFPADVYTLGNATMKLKV